jgi:phage baseplate assembly protein W
MSGVKQDPKSFLGIGWAFPPRLDVDGTVAQAIHEEDIRQAILIIIQTNLGERVMRPDFGADLNSFLFEPVNPTTMAQVKIRVEQAIINWEPRVNVEEVKVTTDPNERNKLLIDMAYRVRVTNSLHNLVYPFYLQEGASS